MASKPNVQPYTFPNLRRPPKHLSGNTVPYMPATAEKYYKVDFYRMLDTAGQQLSEMFRQSGLHTLAQLKSMLLSREVDSSGIASYAELNPATLQTQTNIFKLQIRNSKGSCSSTWRSDNWNMWSVKAGEIVLLTVVSAGALYAEWCFSAPRRLKTWLRSTMSQCRLNSVAVCHIHKDKLDLFDRGDLCVFETWYLSFL